MGPEATGFIDCHCHILPHLDDGASDISESIAMARLATTEGFSHVIATPHYMPGVFEVSPTQVESAVSALNETLALEGIPVTIHPGCELYLDSELPDLLRQKKVLTLNYSKYVLIELPRTDYPRYTEEILFRVCLAGFRPIIAHPERNAAIIANPTMLKPMVERGVALQITAGSLVGEHGRRARIAAERILKSADLWVLGTDWHSGITRPAIFQEALRRAGLAAGNTSVSRSLHLAAQILGIEGKDSNDVR